MLLKSWAMPPASVRSPASSARRGTARATGRAPPRPDALGDVRVDLDEGRVGQSEIAGLDRRASGRRRRCASGRRCRTQLGEDAQLAVDLRGNVAVAVFAALGVVGDELAIGPTRRDELGRQIVERREEPVRGLQPEIGVEEGDALVDAVEGGLQQRGFLVSSISAP